MSTRGGPDAGGAATADNAPANTAARALMSKKSVRLIVEPDDGLEPVRDFIDSARHSLLIKQFTFTEPSLVEATSGGPGPGSRYG